MDPFTRNLQAAHGYLELGLPLEAHDALDEIEPELRTMSKVLAVRAMIYQTLEKWEHLEVVTKQLQNQQPDEPQWPIMCAYATRRAFTLERALSVLLKAVERFPEEATIHYNLACYEAQLGNLEAARKYLDGAIRIEPDFRELALTDIDLQPIRNP